MLRPCLVRKVACVEKRGVLGGTCLNVGCIPSKSLLNNSHIYHQTIHDTKKRGIDVGDVKLNLKQMMAAKDASVEGLTKGVEFLFKKNKVEYIRGTAAFAGEHEVKVNKIEGGEQTLLAKNILIATGSEATPFPGLNIDEKKVITSTGAIALQEVPKKMVVIGGGIIGLEMVEIPKSILKKPADSVGIGLCVVKIRLRCHRSRIPRPNWRTGNGRRDIQIHPKDFAKTGHEIQT